jgi:tetratricopeptide (TPR) repeat protein
LLAILRRSEESTYQAGLAAELDPLNPLILSLCGVAFYEAEEYQSVINHFEKALEFDPRFRLNWGFMRNSYYSIGEHDKWFEIWMKQVCWDDELKEILRKVYYDSGHIATIKELLRSHNDYETDSCFLHPGDFLHWYILLEDYGKVEEYLERELEWMEEAVGESFWWATYYSTNSTYKLFQDYPRYIALLEKMNLPID